MSSLGSGSAARSAWEEVLALYQAEDNAQEKSKLLESLCAVQDLDIIMEFLEVKGK